MSKRTDSYADYTKAPVTKVRVIIMVPMLGDEKSHTVRLDDTKAFCRFFATDSYRVDFGAFSQNADFDLFISKVTSGEEVNGLELGAVEGSLGYYELIQSLIVLSSECDYITSEEAIVAKENISKVYGEAVALEALNGTEVESGTPVVPVIEVIETVTVDNANVDQMATEMENNMNNNTTTQETVNTTNSNTAQETIEKVLSSQAYSFFADNAQAVIRKVNEEMKKSREIYKETVEPDIKKKTATAWEKTQDEKLAKSLSRVTNAIEALKKYSFEGYRGIVALYNKDGWARTIEIHTIIENAIANGCKFRMFPETAEEYKIAGKKLCAAMSTLRVSIRKSAAKIKELLGVDVKGTIANRVYCMLQKVGNLIIFGAKVVISVGTWLFSAVASVAIFIGGLAFKGVSWLFMYVKNSVKANKAVVSMDDKFMDEDEMPEDEDEEDEISRMQKRNAERSFSKPVTQ